MGSVATVSSDSHALRKLRDVPHDTELVPHDTELVPYDTELMPHHSKLVANKISLHSSYCTRIDFDFIFVLLSEMKNVSLLIGPRVTLKLLLVTRVIASECDSSSDSC